jgi:hypothetical protein
MHARMWFHRLTMILGDPDRSLASRLSRIGIKPRRSPLCLGNQVGVVATLQMVWWGQYRKTCTKA